MTTPTTNNVTTHELTFLCIQVDQLILVSDGLRALHQEKGEDKLDHEFDKLQVASNNTTRGVQAQMLSDSERVFRKFIEPSTRVSAFTSLWANVDKIVADTAGARRFYDRNIQHFNRYQYDILLEEDEKFVNSAEIVELQNEITDLKQLIRRLKDLLK